MSGNECYENVSKEAILEGISRLIRELITDTQLMTKRVVAETERIHEIRRCLETGSFSFVSQGIFNKDGALQKTELLARLQGDNGTILPDEFIPTIEAIGQQTVFDYMVIEKAFEAIARINSAIPCSININPTTFEMGEYFLDYIDQMQLKYPIDPKLVIWEILETEPIKDYKNFNTILSELRKKGYKIAIDDFHPVGNNNMICVDNLHEIDTVKIDGVFMCELYSQRDHHSFREEFQATIRGILHEHTHIDIVVERIENREMFEFFRDIFAEFDIKNIHFQGYYFDHGTAF